MKQKFMIGLLLILGSAMTVSCCLAEDTRANSETSTTKSEIKQVYWNNGKLRYEGEMNGSGLPHGFGTFYNKDGIKVYEGNWKKGLREGNGVLYWATEYGTKERYHGQWEKDLPYRYGWYESKDGAFRMCDFQRETMERQKMEWSIGLPIIGRTEFLLALPLEDRTPEQPWFLGGISPNERYKYKCKISREHVKNLTDEYLESEKTWQEDSDITEMYTNHPLLFKDTEEI